MNGSTGGTGNGRTEARPARSGSASGSSNGDSRNGPRRLWKRMDSASAPAGSSPRRSTAGDDSRCAWAGRNTQMALSPAWANTCSLRNSPGRARFSQISTPPKALLRRTCSAAHRRSAGLSARTQTICSGEKSQPTSLTAFGRCGGAISATRPAPVHNVDNAGRSNRHSPIPDCGHSSSVNPPRGQPPPGNSAFSESYPVVRTRPSPRARWPALHNAGCSVSGNGRVGLLGTGERAPNTARPAGTGYSATSSAMKRDGDNANMETPKQVGGYCTNIQYHSFSSRRV
ncbi:hypothetical protein LMG19083_03259 [Ralstonia psammae]|uniref:Uncharacterized protein n=1 Tax=Ralstonia psammae TaxID=3058598 RepID=A0ABM9JPA4_9RALS|nr:hypothetical protein LMG19083_03259 [Ralstonia sp. LMG 19083]